MNTKDYATHYAALPPFEQDFRIGLQSFKNLTTMHPHWHEHLEFVYITAGTGVFISAGVHFPVSVGDLVIADPNTLHLLRSERGIDYHCLLIRPDLFEEDDIDTVIFESLIKADTTVRDLFAALKAEYTAELPAANLVKKSIVYRLLAYLARNYAKPALSREDITHRAAALSRMKRVEDFVSQNYKNKISTADLARIFYVSENHFCRLFKRSVGITAIDYINEYRIGKAELLLEKTELSITEVATAVGFENANYFSRVFNKLRKQAPSEYRKRHK